MAELSKWRLDLAIDGLEPGVDHSLVDECGNVLLSQEALVQALRIAARVLDEGAVERLVHVMLQQSDLVGKQAAQAVINYLLEG